jgi:hypothetical protein
MRELSSQQQRQEEEQQMKGLLNTENVPSTSTTTLA